MCRPYCSGYNKVLYFKSAPILLCFINDKPYMIPTWHAYHSKDLKMSFPSVYGNRLYAAEWPRKPIKSYFPFLMSTWLCSKFVDVNISPTLERTNVIYLWKGQTQTYPMVPRTHTYTKVMSIQTPIETCMQKPRLKIKKINPERYGPRGGLIAG